MLAFSSDGEPRRCISLFDRSRRPMENQGGIVADGVRFLAVLPCRASASCRATRTFHETNITHPGRRTMCNSVRLPFTMPRRLGWPGGEGRGPRLSPWVHRCLSIRVEVRGSWPCTPFALGRESGERLRLRWAGQLEVPSVLLENLVGEVRGFLNEQARRHLRQTTPRQHAR
jgi:hypothetical protein